MDLREKRCVPCEGGVSRLVREEQERLAASVPSWRVEGEKLIRTFTFDDFAGAMAVIGRVAVVGGAGGPDPDFCVHFRRVEMSIWTHAIGGLSENDFILAAKIDAVEEASIASGRR